MNHRSINSPNNLQENRSLHRVMIEINTELAIIHKKLKLQIVHTDYEVATSYISQFISYTTIWNLKFTYNLESPEVALMQILHLEYIFEHELPHLFAKERTTLIEMTNLFLTYSPYSKNLMLKRRQQFLAHLEGN